MDQITQRLESGTLEVETNRTDVSFFFSFFSSLFVLLLAMLTH